MDDLKLFEKSKIVLSKEVEIKADSGYQGLQKKHGLCVDTKEENAHYIN